MDTFTVCFFGHRYMEQMCGVEDKIENLLGELLRSKPYVECLIGRDGEFDILAASVIRRLDKRLGRGNCSMVWVQPYAKCRKDEEFLCAYYDEIEVCESSARAHPKAAFRIRNEEMIRRADMVVVYVTHEGGGAYRALQYAQKLGKIIVRL